MKKINILLPALFFLGILNNSSTFAGNSCSGKTRVRTLDAQAEIPSKPFDTMLNEDLDFREFEDFKVLMAFKKTNRDNKKSVLMIIKQQTQGTNTNIIVNAMNIKCNNIFEAITGNLCQEIYIYKNQINTPSNHYYYQTPLSYAIQNNKSPEIIFLLLLLGANIRAQDSNGITPIILAEELISNLPPTATVKTNEEMATISAIQFCSYEDKLKHSELTSKSAD